ncbi:hypothetical protein LEN26_015669 [Aphanomyces euteiches]|nr:hypothetical protein LEN26_015669 [Aphanomyces euteiches]KAH9104725.1 hypothetical protein AeMF1_019313 [Aphanomyces euteiches]
MGSSLKAVDVVGCSSGDGTRSCESHAICGENLSVNDIVVIRWSAEIGANGDVEGTLKVFQIHGTQETCHVGYLPARLVRRYEEFANKMAIVVEDYRSSESLAKRNRSDRCVGLVKAVLLEHVEEYNRS